MRGGRCGRRRRTAALVAAAALLAFAGGALARGGNPAAALNPPAMPSAADVAAAEAARPDTKGAAVGTGEGLEIEGEHAADPEPADGGKEGLQDSDTPFSWWDEWKDNMQ